MKVTGSQHLEGHMLAIHDLLDRLLNPFPVWVDCSRGAAIYYVYYDH